nr:MAG TPA: hypothetical protein [Caudoviricetes sp.]
MTTPWLSPVKRVLACPFPTRPLRVSELKIS